MTTAVVRRRLSGVAGRVLKVSSEVAVELQGTAVGSRVGERVEDLMAARRRRAAAAAHLPNRCATASLVVGVLSVVTGFLLGVPAVLLALMGLRRPRHRRRAVVGLVLGSMTSLVSLVLLMVVIENAGTIMGGYRTFRTVMWVVDQVRQLAYE